jgi:GT2 family glycosyltransferase
MNSKCLAPNYSKDKCRVSVVICTYKRVEMLQEMLATLLEQDMDGSIQWEILVIDNDAEGSAMAVCHLAKLSHDITLRYICESSPGLSHARNRGIKESRGIIVAFLDDDTLVSRRWLMELVATFDRTKADCVGGRVLVKWDGSPEDVVKACEKEIVAFDKGADDCRLLGRNVPIGANLALRADVLSEQCLFLPSLGRNQGNLMGCEEIELLLRLVKQGRSIWYSGGAVVLHRTSSERLTAAYYIRREYWNGVSLALVDRLQQSILYYQCKAWARLFQIGLLVVPAWLWAVLARDKASRFSRACRCQKYYGYWSGMMGFAQQP